MPYCKVNNIQLHYESIRVSDPDSDRTVLLFLHEALGSIPQWKSFPSELCSKLNLNGIVYERQGHGLSSPFSKPRTENYLHEYAFEELKAFIEEIFSPDQRIILVGHSDGGTIALLYASKIPGKIAGIITMAAHVINEPETIAGIKPAVDAYENGKLQKLNDFHGDKTEALFYAWANTWNLEAFKTWNICQDINGIQSPTLVLQGEKDQYGSTRQMELIKESITADCELKLIQKAAHIPHLENKGVVINTIQTWVQKQKNILYL